MATHVLDIQAFRALFPEFANPVTYPDAVIEVQWAAAGAFISQNDGPLLCGAPLQAAINYMTAHLMKSAAMLAAGQTAVIVKGSTVDKVTVSLQPPPTKDLWSWWLATTPYGTTLSALLQAQGAGGFYFGGLPEQSAFRRVGGRFGRW